MSFLGFYRQNGTIGTRNYVGLISVVSCANDLTWWISQRIEGCSLFLHGQGCCQTQPDLEIVTRTLISIGQNPNLGAVLLISLGCESVSVNKIAEGIQQSGKTVKILQIQKIGGATKAMSEGCKLAQAMKDEISLIKRREVPDSELILGVKCGASDTTSGLMANPVTGAACDLLVDNGGTCVFGETTEFIGAEHILAKRAATAKVAKKIIDSVHRMEKRAMAMGFDMRGGQPTSGNIAGGLSTIEEKSLGAIVKAGSKIIQDVCQYGERPKGKGLFIVDTPGREPEFLTALAAAGCQVVVFTTGIGAPQGFPFIPVIKITSNPKTYLQLEEHIDLFTQPSHNEKAFIAKASKTLYEYILAVACGEKTKAEILNYGNFPNICVIGPTI
jgi:altronate dehydratase large subunit